MSKTDVIKEMKKAITNFSSSYYELLAAIEDYELASGKSINDWPGFTEKYPFESSLNEYDLCSWANAVLRGADSASFQVISYEYLNTGGNTMVGIFEVWLPDEKRMVYALTNEEGCSLSVVDYIRNDLGDVDADEFIFDYIDWGLATGYEKYFELYRHCLNVYTKDDCKYFGYTRGIPVHLLSDELKAKVPEGYLQWLESGGYDSVDTNGLDIIKHPDWQELQEESTNSSSTVEVDDEYLQQVKDFKSWHDDIPADDEVKESFYDKDYLITLGDKTVRIPFNADTWSLVDDILANTIEEY